MDRYLRQDLALACIHIAQQILEEDELAERRGHAPQLRARQEALQELVDLGPDASFDLMTDLLWRLYRSSSARDKARHLVAQQLLEWAGRRDIAFSAAVGAAYTLYRMSTRGSEEHQQAIQMLLGQTCWPGVSMAQAVEATMVLCMVSPLRSEERKLAIQNLSELAQRPGLTVEDILVFVTLDSELVMMTIASTRALEEEQLALRKQLLLALAQRPDLTPKQSAQIAEALATFK